MSFFFRSFVWCDRNLGCCVMYWMNVPEQMNIIYELHEGIESEQAMKLKTWSVNFSFSIVTKRMKRALKFKRKSNCQTVFMCGYKFLDGNRSKCIFLLLISHNRLRYFKRSLVKFNYLLLTIEYYTYHAHCDNNSNSSRLFYRGTCFYSALSVYINT